MIDANNPLKPRPECKCGGCKVEMTPTFYWCPECNRIFYGENGGEDSASAMATTKR